VHRSTSPRGTQISTTKRGYSQIYHPTDLSLYFFSPPLLQGIAHYVPTTKLDPYFVSKPSYFFFNTSFFLKMPPRRDPLRVDSHYNTSNPVQVLTSVLNELLRMQQQNKPDPLWLDTLIQLPKFSWKNNGEVLDSWIYRISQYFNTCRGLTEERKLQIIALQLEGPSQLPSVGYSNPNP
jgi:hypothetical protein